MAVDRIKDEFLKLEELEEFLDKDEESEYEVKNKNKRGKHKEEDELDLFSINADEEDEPLGDLMYDDFFRPSKEKKNLKQKSNFESKKQRKGKLSTLSKSQSQIAESERRMLEPKTWTMQGEVTATQRPKNSALEVDLDFERNDRPPPLITEEYNSSLEDLIKKRILEGRFDDVQKPPSLPTKAQRKHKELDETKSKKGLGEIYEDEYVQKTNPNAAPITPSDINDRLKRETSKLFKKICVQLDSLSHFHFAPKPVIEEMSIQSTLPAIAMEEVAPMSISDAAMLAPEEIYDGKGDFKEETELTRAERKRRRANKKRKFKATHAPKKGRQVCDT